MTVTMTMTMQEKQGTMPLLKIANSEKKSSHCELFHTATSEGSFVPNAWSSVVILP